MECGKLDKAFTTVIDFDKSEGYWGGDDFGRVEHKHMQAMLDWAQELKYRLDLDPNNMSNEILLRQFGGGTGIISDIDKEEIKNNPDQLKTLMINRGLLTADEAGDMSADEIIFMFEASQKN